MVICRRFKVTRQDCAGVVLKTNAQRSNSTTWAWFLAMFCCIAEAMAPAYAASVNLRWDTSSDSRVTGYRLYYGPRARTYTNSVDAGNANSRLVGGLGAGATYFFAVTSYNRLGIESPPSNEISYAPTNLPPSISTVSNQAVALDQATAAIPFVVGDADTPAANLTISGVAANPALVSLITLGGSGSNRTVKVSPVAGKSGTTTITVS